MNAKPLTNGALGLWDCVSVIVGIVVGTAIFKLPALVFKNTPSLGWGLAVWCLGGFLSLIGAFCYAELATTYPRSGGDYEYLRRSFGPFSGFIFGWAQLTIVLTGNMGAMAYAFADYGAPIFRVPDTMKVGLAIGAVLALTMINLVGVNVGKRAQNWLTAAKVIGLVAIVLAGLLVTPSETASAKSPISTANFGLALVFVMYAYGGWNHAAFVAAEVRDGATNIPRALIFGVALITVVYLGINATIYYLLGRDLAITSSTPAADVMHLALGDWGDVFIRVLVMISALSAINGMILTGACIYASMGEDRSMMRWLGVWDPRRGPVRSILVQSAVGVGLIVAVGTHLGRKSIDHGLTILRLRTVPWDTYDGGFGALFAASAPIFWLFFLLVGIASIVLRRTDAKVARPFCTPFHPLMPLVFCLTSGYMLYCSVDHARSLTLLGLATLVPGILVYWLDKRSGLSSARHNST